MAEIRFTLEELDQDLPPVCMACGEESAIVRRQRLTWWPLWTYWLLLLHPLIWGVAVLFAGRQVVVHAPLCDAHQDHWRLRKVLVWSAGILFGLIMVMACIGPGIMPWLIKARRVNLAAIALLGGQAPIGLWLLFVAFIHRNEIRAVRITHSEVVLTGVAEEFVDAVVEADFHRFRQSTALGEEQPAMEELTRRRTSTVEATAIRSGPPFRQYLKDALDGPPVRGAPPSEHVQE